MTPSAPIHPGHAWILGLVIEDDEPEDAPARGRSDEDATPPDVPARRPSRADRPASRRQDAR